MPAVCSYRQPPGPASWAGAVAVMASTTETRRSREVSNSGSVVVARCRPNEALQAVEPHQCGGESNGNGVSDVRLLMALR